MQRRKPEIPEKKMTDLYLASLPINWTMHLRVITGMEKRQQVTLWKVRFKSQNMLFLVFTVKRVRDNCSTWARNHLFSGLRRQIKKRKVEKTAEIHKMFQKTMNGANMKVCFEIFSVWNNWPCEQAFAYIQDLHIILKFCFMCLTSFTTCCREPSSAFWPLPTTWEGWRDITIISPHTQMCNRLQQWQPKLKKTKRGDACADSSTKIILL